MFDEIIKSIFWDPSEKKVREIEKEISKINELENSFKDYTLEDVKNKTNEFRKLFENLDFKNEIDSKRIKEILDSIKLEAFALVKKTANLILNKQFTLKDGRSFTWNMVPYDVQLIWWLAINSWAIAEMKTWEWKTLVATMPAYLNALTWNSVHIVTVNDYLAVRDANEMWVLYDALGLTTWVITNSMSPEEKKESYSSDIIYATNNELGFDYLRDNMVPKKEYKVQSSMFFAIIDEVDSILIDEARTPLIISTSSWESTSKYSKFATLAKNLENNQDYKIDEKWKTATLTEAWIKKIEELLHIENIYVSSHYNDLHHIENALKAMAVYIKDRDYLVKDEQVMIIDEHNWRVLAWRRYSDWLHQALEAKEKVKIQQESKTLASITFQNYFRMYWKLSWMTWTAKTEEEEFYKVYGLETLVIPTNKPIVREDKTDLLFKNEKGKFDYVVNLIKELSKTGQPILVWTVSVEKSEYLSNRLSAEWIKHSVLNAKHHESEAEIIANAWQKWAITIATNMAWRWTDIKLGEWVKELWWLIILWTEKHETRRIDNQLRWRAGRQWDKWMTQFLISPNDEIMRRFWGEKLFSIFNSPMFSSLPDDEPITQNSMLTKRIISVQKQVEWYNFDIRKNTLEYDDVINKHRTIIYSRRNKVLDSKNIDEDVMNMIQSQISKLIIANFDEENKSNLIKKINEFLGIELIDDRIENDDVNWSTDANVLADYINKIAIEEIEKIKKLVSSEEEFYELERKIVLQSIDELWMRHIDAMTRLKEDVAFEWYAQKNPLVVYKEKAFEKFSDLIYEIEYKTTKAIFSINMQTVVDSINIDNWNLEINEDDLEKMLSNFSEWEKEEIKKQISSWNTNPLFANPVPQPNITPRNEPKKRIRV